MSAKRLPLTLVHTPIEAEADGESFKKALYNTYQIFSVVLCSVFHRES